MDLQFITDILEITADILDRVLGATSWPEALVAITAIIAGAWVLRAFLLKK
jgi:hypothetical protein